MAKRTKISTLPSTEGIKDPEVKFFLDSLVNSWDARSGFKDENNGERFVRLEEINSLATKAITGVFGGRGAWLTNGAPGLDDIPSAQEINDALDALADFIRKSIVYQILEQTVQPIDISDLRTKIDAAMKGAATAIVQEREERSSADEAMVTSLNAFVARLGATESAVANEVLVRSQKDNALAQAINSIWANIGGNQALIQDGALAAVSPAAVSATKWTQVQAAAIDPNTGQPNSAIVRQEFEAYANKADGTFRSIYSVRAQTSVNGQTIVGGFGLAATTGAGGGQGPTIDFGVRADKFFIAATSATPDAATQMAAPASIPFIVLTRNEIVNGVTYPPGVYIKKAVIGEATIGTAQIANAAITRAKIKDLEVTNAKIANATIESLKIGGGQVTAMNFGSAGGGGVAGGSNFIGASVGLTMPSGSSGVVVTGIITLKAAQYNTVGELAIYHAASWSKVAAIQISIVDDKMYTYPICGCHRWPDAGNNDYVITLSPAGGSGGATIQSSSITATGGKR